QLEHQEDPERDPDRPLLHGIFQIGANSHDVLLSAQQVTWTPIQPETPTGLQVVRRQQCLLLKDVYAVKVRRRRGAGQQTGGALQGLTLFHCRPRPGGGAKLKDHALHLNNMSVDHCEVWFKRLREILSGYHERPKLLKVFINPSSHRKEAVHIYRQDVAPLFRLADVKTDITITEEKGHILSVLKETKLEDYHGVVCVGGDGTVAELIHGLVLKAQLDAQTDPDSCCLTPASAPLPLGIIPAGSTDVVACSVHGIRHPVTAAMHIILGHLQPVDVCSFSSLGRLLRFGCSSMFGFGGQTLQRAEGQRWMPPSQRRDYAFIKTLANLRPVQCELSFLPSDQEESALNPDTEEEESWRTNQGLYLNISVMAIPCLCSMAPRGLAPTTRLANGSMALITAENTSRSEFIKHLKRYSSLTNQFSFPFVETHTVRAVRLRPCSVVGWPDEVSEVESKSTPILSSEGSFPWNIDGELLEIANEVLIRVHPRLLLLYGEDLEEAEETPIKCGCI
ncbi:ceramide kinase-like protein, partial [Aplochiton taeniatus]